MASMSLMSTMIWVDRVDKKSFRDGKPRYTR